MTTPTIMPTFVAAAGLFAAGYAGAVYGWSPQLITELQDNTEKPGTGLPRDPWIVPAC